MKKLFSVVLLIVSISSFSQPNKKIKNNCAPCVAVNYTSVSAFTDVKPTDNFFTSLQSLVERYGINVAPCSNNTFGGNTVVNRAMLVQMLSSSLNQLTQLKEMAVSQKPKPEQDTLLNKMLFGQYNPAQKMWLLAYFIKDVKKSDCYYTDLEVLCKFNVDLANKNNFLLPTSTINPTQTMAMLTQIFKGVNYTSPTTLKKTITKGELVILLNGYLDGYNEYIATKTMN